MFVGHLAVGFAAKAAAPKTSLGTLMAAPLLLDLLWPIFLFAGWEQVRIDPGNTAVTPLAFVHYPITHSLVAAFGWGAAFAAACWLRARQGAVALVIGAGVVSHWILDAVSHRPDMPLAPWSDLRVGLGLWNSIPGTVLVEALLFGCGVWIYRARSRPKDRLGSPALWSFVVVMALFYVGNVWGPPPPSERALAWFALLLWIVPFWAGWVDRHWTFGPVAERAA